MVSTISLYFTFLFLGLTTAQDIEVNFPGPICNPCFNTQVCSVRLMFDESTPVPAINSLTVCRSRLQAIPNGRTIFVDNARLPACDVTYTPGNFPSTVSSSALGQLYDNNIDCTLNFDQGATDVTTLESLTSFVVESTFSCVFDQLEITYQESGGTVRRAQFCGFSENGLNLTITGPFSLRFRTDFSVRESGFLFSINPGTSTFNCLTANPCDPLSRAGRFYYPHDDPTMFVQCDEHSGCFELQCEPGTVWDVENNACSFPSK